jgi:hypothetical protein
MQKLADRHEIESSWTRRPLTLGSGVRTHARPFQSVVSAFRGFVKDEPVAMHQLFEAHDTQKRLFTCKFGAGVGATDHLGTGPAASAATERQVPAIRPSLPTCGW